MKQVHVYISGDVIGVGFRAWTKIQAKPLSINGWIRNVFNHPDIFGSSGGVEAVFQGDDENVSKIVELVKKGPSISMVRHVEVIEQHISETFSSFEIIK